MRVNTQYAIFIAYLSNYWSVWFLFFLTYFVGCSGWFSIARRPLAHLLLFLSPSPLIFILQNGQHQPQRREHDDVLKESEEERNWCTKFLIGMFIIIAWWI